ncbi:hypothetical protein [Pseudodesulfovibrio karagichevae]|uniref:Uncharacterized protein n=1 Tax=Pseudodesulfovibrio karagichevae TaxID=3239305 RepID=A0ABV4K4B0_9BACT
MSDKTPMYFYIKSAVYSDYAIVAGDKADNHVYFQKPDGRENAQWCFKDVGNGTYTICDKLHQRCLAAGESADNHLYHQSDTNRLMAKWEAAIKELDGLRGLALIDCFHHFTIASPIKNDGHVYHQDLNNDKLLQHPYQGDTPIHRECMIWELEPVAPVAEGLDIPNCYACFAGKTEVKVGTPVYGTPSEIFGAEQTVDNSSAISGTSTVELKDSLTISSTIEFSEAVSKSQAEDIAWNAGLALGLSGDTFKGKASGGYSHTTKQEKSFSQETSTSHTLSETREYSTKGDFNFGAHSAFRVRLAVTLRPVTVPFTVSITLPLAQGKTLSHTIQGTYKAQEFMKTDMKIE